MEKNKPDDGKISLGRLQALLSRLIDHLGAEYRVSVNVGLDLNRVSDEAAVAQLVAAVPCDEEAHRA